MKRLKKYFLVSLSLILILSLIAGCSGKKSYDNVASESKPGSPPMEAPAPAPNFDIPGEKDSGFTTGQVSPLEPEKIITTVYLNFETMEFEASNDNLNKLIDKYKAYVESSNISYSNYYNSKMYRSGNYIIRVPRENVTSFKTKLNIIGNKTSEETSKQDVTKQYTDTESRLRVITTKEERILALLEKAEKIEDIIQLENQLSQIIYEKESLKSSLITLDDLVDYSTVHIGIREVEKLTNSETIETTFGTKVLNAINDSLFFFKNAIQGFIISLIYLLPFAIVAGVILLVVFRVLKKFRAKIKKD